MKKAQEQMRSIVLMVERVREQNNDNDDLRLRFQKFLRRVDPEAFHSAKQVPLSYGAALALSPQRGR